MTRVAPDGSKTEIGKAGGGPNGLATGPGRRALCLQQWRRGLRDDARASSSTGPAPDYKGGTIQRIDPKTGETKTLYSEVNGHKLSAPNDLVFDRQGGFYFTDLGKRYTHQRDNGGLYYALPDGSSIKELVYPIVTPNGVGLSPDEQDRLCRRYRDLAHLSACEIAGARQAQARAVPGALWRALRLRTAGLPALRQPGVEADGNICVATLVTGYITVISPSGQVVRQVKMPDVYPTNICFGGPTCGPPTSPCRRPGSSAVDGLARAGAEAQFHVLSGDGRSDRRGPAAHLYRRE